jgi:glycosyltransferase involved in cell wall biosynthesis
MNILILNWRDPKQANAGGAEQVTLEHAKGWIEKGHTVWWFSSHFPEANRKDHIEGLTIIRYGYYAFGVQIAACIWYLLGKHPKFDLVIDQFHGLPFFTPLYVRVKKLGFIHEVAREVWKLNPWPWPFNMLVSLLGTTFEPFIFRFLYNKMPFLTVSESTRDDLVTCGVPRENITVIHNGVKLDDMPIKIPPKEVKKTALFLGAISHDKGISDALRVFEEIKKRDQDWQFWIVGKASLEMEKFLNDQIYKRGLTDSTTYFGFVDNKKKFELLARAHIMINPSIHEGWGLVNIEANAVGTPVLAYDVKGVRDSIKNNITGVLVDKGRVEELAHAGIELLNDKSKYRKIQKVAIDRSTEFVWVNSKQKSVRFVEEMLGGN